ncbi:hypothetical protein SCAR479_09328 [Seiridium cardinale]|uniref:Uncharacterized protein n=1 Tax=Seiridium cardinale TaxID=138064 RepID=A0ABR2XJL4_9PEZI
MHSSTFRMMRNGRESFSNLAHGSIRKVAPPVRKHVHLAVKHPRCKDCLHQSDIPRSAAITQPTCNLDATHIDGGKEDLLYNLCWERLAEYNGKNIGFMVAVALTFTLTTVMARLAIAMKSCAFMVGSKRDAKKPKQGTSLIFGEHVLSDLDEDVKGVVFEADQNTTTCRSVAWRPFEK